MQCRVGFHVIIRFWIIRKVSSVNSKNAVYKIIPHFYYDYLLSLRSFENSATAVNKTSVDEFIAVSQES